MNNIPQQGFYFDGENGRHDYFYDGAKMTGCTTILSVIAKPFLIQWAANMAVDYIADKSIFFESTNEYKTNGDILREARTAHRKKKEEAGTKGTDVHAIIENMIKFAIKEREGIIDCSIEHENKQVENFVEWALKNKVKFLESEKQLYSKELWIAGTCDFICKIDGKVWLGDIKTSSGIYPEYFAQCAGYQIMIDENKLYEIVGHIIVNLKKTGEFEEKRSISLEDYKRFFLAALDIYRVQEKIKGQIL
jgi:hypothetical protein